MSTFVTPPPWPRYIRERTVTIAFIIDTSGSIHETFLGMFVDAINDCMRVIEPAEVWLIQCDQEVTDVKHYVWPHVTALKAPSGLPEFKGERLTAFTPPFRYMVRNRIRVKNIIYMTDLYPTAESREDLDREIPVLFRRIGARKLLWLVPEDVKGTDYWKPPVGKIIWITPLL